MTDCCCFWKIVLCWFGLFGRFAWSKVICCFNAEYRSSTVAYNRYERPFDISISWLISSFLARVLIAVNHDLMHLAASWPNSFSACDCAASNREIQQVSSWRKAQRQVGMIPLSENHSELIHHNCFHHCVWNHGEFFKRNHAYKPFLMLSVACPWLLAWLSSAAEMTFMPFQLLLSNPSDPIQRHQGLRWYGNRSFDNCIVLVTERANLSSTSNQLRIKFTGGFNNVDPCC